MCGIDQYLEEQSERFETELCELLRIPSVSADPACREDVRRAADWVTDQFRRMDFATEIIPTAGHPLVYAESTPVEGAATVLVYGHYDVQPPDPLDEWISPPFEPTQRDGSIFARGATDDKGQILTHLKSAEAHLAVNGRLPVNLKYLIEGEEEVGSRNLKRFIAENTDRLACDCVVISDGSQFAPGRPAIDYGIRGIAYYELRLEGPRRDLHSGSFGGPVTNPANALAQMLAALVDRQGKIQVPGFYDDVAPLSDSERQRMAALPFDEAGFMEQIGVTGLNGESGYSALEQRWARPTYDISGLASGYQGEGAKTVLPAAATGKFSFRLVPNQNPAEITQSLRSMLVELCPPGITMELIDLHGSPGVLVSPDSPYMRAAARAIDHAFGCPPVLTREGGTIPVVVTFHETLQVDTLLLGWGQDDDNTHSPNEKFSLSDFHRGIKASARLWTELSEMENKQT